MMQGDGKMTASAEPQINPQRYAELLSKTLPKAITTEEDNDHYLEVVNELMAKGEDNLTPEEDALLELLFVLIEKYEDEHYQLNAATPLGILRELMEARSVKPSDLWSLFGSKGIASEVMSGKRAISKRHAKKLAEYFKVSVELFI